MFLTVLVPTYRRPDSLSRCLLALAKQKRKADEIIVCVREDDLDTTNLLKSASALPVNLKMVTVCAAGVIAAMNRGLEAAQGDILAITDDDAAPHPDWLERIEIYFRTSPDLGGVGGRDFTPDSHGRPRLTVGKVQWFGRVIGNHHLGCGPARQVDELKGVNCAYRLPLLKEIGFDTRLRGSGAQAHWELALAFRIKKAGFKLIYDPEIAVDHFAEPRFDEDDRETFSEEALANAIFNQTLILLENLSSTGRAAFVIWFLIIGGGDAFGLLQFLRYLPSLHGQAVLRLRASLKGRFRAWRAWRSHPGQPANLSG